MTNVHTIPLHLGDLLTDTMHLSAAELGAYVRLLAVHYRMGTGGLPDDDVQLRRITGLDNKTWKSSRPTILGFFEMSGNRRWVHGRVQKTLSEITQKQEQNRSKALKRWESGDAAALPQHSRGSATAMQSISHKPVSKGEGKPSPSAYPPEFESFWAVYPKNNGSKKEAAKSYQSATKRGASHATIIDGAARYAAFIAVRPDGANYTKHATTWLNGEFWESAWDIGSAPPAGGSEPKSRFQLAVEATERARAARESGGAVQA